MRRWDLRAVSEGYICRGRCGRGWACVAWIVILISVASASGFLRVSVLAAFLVVVAGALLTWRVRCAAVAGSGLNAIAVGTGAKAIGDSSISIGTGNTVRGNNSGAIGDPTTIDAIKSYSVGNGNNIGIQDGALTDGVFVMGNGVTVGAGATGALVLGSGVNLADGLADALVLGNRASVSVDGGVALGSDSSATGAGLA